MLLGLSGKFQLFLMIFLSSISSCSGENNHQIKCCDMNMTLNSGNMAAQKLYKSYYNKAWINTSA